MLCGKKSPELTNMEVFMVSVLKKLESNGVMRGRQDTLQNQEVKVIRSCYFSFTDLIAKDLNFYEKEVHVGMKIFPFFNQLYLFYVKHVKRNNPSENGRRGWCLC
ncbi:hypothetical protein KIL84_004873 [Mauremys mutica]|uniref:Uncharacterized protein n=1 Tax=Mauremys mutica TaxID=74926 RepID=A0A9D3XPX0_9SAUR|nr:hypothetical protein KIL84_004873 [Mauremys mutica]